MGELMTDLEGIPDRGRAVRRRLAHARRDQDSVGDDVADQRQEGRGGEAVEDPHGRRHLQADAPRRRWRQGAARGDPLRPGAMFSVALGGIPLAPLRPSSNNPTGGG